MHRSLSALFVFVLVLGLIAPAAAGAAPASEPAAPMSSALRISQAYGGGGGSTGTYLYDYAEVFNSGTSAATLTGYSLQYGSSSGNFGSSASNIYAFPSGTTIQPGRYLLVQLGAAGTAGAALPVTPDLITTNIAASGTSGKMALANVTTALGCGATATLCTLPDARIIDLVSYGVSNNAEGGATVNNGTALTSTQGAVRKGDGCTDTDNNNADFTVVPNPVPRNSASTAVSCTVTPVAPSITTQPASTSIASGSTATLSVVATGTAPLSYQWYQGTASDTSTPVGTDSSTYTTPALTSTTSYWVRVTNSVSSVDSNTATVTVETTATAPSITTQPASTSITSGGSATLSVVATGTAPLSYQWYQGTASDTSTPVGTNSDTFITPALTTTTSYWVHVSNSAGGADSDTATVTVAAACGAADLPVGTVEGTTDTSPYASQTVTVQGVVVGDYELPAGSNMIRGFFLQDAGDSNPATSDGVFVYTAGTDTVSLGQTVQVTGSVSEYQGQTQITTSAASIELCGTGATVTPVDVTLPLTTASDLEKYEGMFVRFPQTLFVTEIYLLGRFGQVTLSSGAKLPQPTNIVLPGAPAQAQQAANDLNKIVLDDDNNNQNGDPISYGRGGLPLSASNTLRGGDTVNNLTGVLTYSWGGNSASPNAWRVRGLGDLDTATPYFNATNARPSAPPAVGGRLKIASSNVLNYFLTLDIGTQANCGPIGYKQECRGAETSEELTRQQTKLNAALLKIDADIVGLMELENTQGGGGNDVNPLADVVARLNTSLSGDIYGYVDTGIVGTDTIRVGLIYKKASVTPTGAPMIDSDPIHNRPPVAQVFTENATGAKLSVVVNHFKSKGCSGATGSDADQGDGQSCWNATRVSQSTELLSFINNTLVPAAGDPDVMLLGDFNSYAKEDPISSLESGGFTNLISHFEGTNAYSYVFDGQWGYLDQGLATASLLGQVNSAAEYHIDSDEPSVLDYNTNFKSAGQITSLYAPDEFRISDHDPVVIGVNLTVPDTTAPDTAIDSNPTNPSNSASGTFTFTATEAGSTFECSLDSAAFTACTSPKTYTGLTEGSHTFQVRAVDAAGNKDATPASYTWLVDTTAPDTTIDTGPGNPTSWNSDAFTFSGTDSGGGIAGFECSLDGAAFAACTSPQNYTGLADGSHTFQVRAVDAVGNKDASPASFTWTVDATAPDTTIDSKPANPTNSTSATFNFSGTDAGTGVAMFECSLDGANPATCTSPKTYTGLSLGSHTFEVRAIDQVFNVDASPASYTWDIVAPTPVLAPETTTPMFCVGEDITINLQLYNIVNMYGYQFHVNYDSTKVSAVGAFDNSWFNTLHDAIVPGGYNAACAGGVCKFAASKMYPAPALSGSGRLGTITLTGLSAGTVDLTVTNDVLSDVDGMPLTHTVAALQLTVCGLADLSGKISLQGRSTPVSAGTITLTDTSGTFGPRTVQFSATDGSWSITGVKVLPTGSAYKLVADHSLYLANFKQLTLMPAANYAGLNTRLWGGDANNDEMIDIGDLTCVAGAFGGSPATCGTTGSSDINEDGTTNIQDLSLTGGNYTKSGEQAW